MNNGHWRLIEDGLCLGGLNMGADLALLHSCEKGAAPPTLRLYGWQSPTLSIGHSQNASREVNLERCRELGIPVVRRPTGGKAILHGGEITYAVAAPTAQPMFSRGVRKTLMAIGKALIAGLEELGVGSATLNAGKNNGSADGSMASPACFASLNHFEILVDGRKLSGSAQKRNRRAFLQHGSILIDFDRELFLSLLKFENSASLENHLDNLKKSSITLNEIRREKTGFQEAAHALRKGFQKEFPGAWVPGKLLREEEIFRDDLARTAILQ